MDGWLPGYPPQPGSEDAPDLPRWPGVMAAPAIHPTWTELVDEVLTQLAKNLSTVPLDLDTVLRVSRGWRVLTVSCDDRGIGIVVGSMILASGALVQRHYPRSSTQHLVPRSLEPH